MRMYNKIFAKILDSSIWLEDVNTRIIWVTFLAAMDQDGYAHFSAIANLANRARVPIKDTERAVKKLSSPDPDSADPEFEGRRIERVPGGFLILNAEKYRGIVTRIVQREQTKKRVAKHRAKKGNATVTHSNESVTPSEADTYTYTKEKIKTKARFTRPAVNEVRDYCNRRNNSVDAETFVDFYDANGWVQGKGKPIKDWKACVRTWEKSSNQQENKGKIQRAIDAIQRAENDTLRSSETGNGQNDGKATGLLPES